MGCFRLPPSALAAAGHTYLATPDHIEQALMFEGGPDAVCVWRHCLRQGPTFRLYIDQLATVLPISADRIRAAFRAMERQRVAWRTVGERDARGRLAGSHWNVSSLPQEPLQAAPPAESPTPPFHRGSVNPALTKNEDRDVTETKKTSVYTRDAFERLWDAYPVKANEVGAYEAFSAYVEHMGLTEVDIDQFATNCVNDIQRRVSHGEWAATGEFVPHLKTYIRDRRWNDPPRAQKAPAVRRAQTPPEPRQRQTRDLTLPELLTDTSWAFQDGAGAPEPQSEGRSPAKPLELAPSASQAHPSEGSEHELERPRNFDEYRAQQVALKAQAEPAGAEGSPASGHGGVFAIRQENPDTAWSWS